MQGVGEEISGVVAQYEVFVGHVDAVLPGGVAYLRVGGEGETLDFSPSRVAVDFPDGVGGAGGDAVQAVQALASGMLFQRPIGHGAALAVADPDVADGHGRHVVGVELGVT